MAFGKTELKRAVSRKRTAVPAFTSQRQERVDKIKVLNATGTVTTTTHLSTEDGTPLFLWKVTGLEDHWVG